MKIFALQMLQVSKYVYLSYDIDGRKVQIKITEYCPELLRPIRRASGFSEDFLI